MGYKSSSSSQQKPLDDDQNAVISALQKQIMELKVSGAKDSFAE